VGGREHAPPDMFVVHGSFASCAGPGGVPAPPGAFCVSFLKSRGLTFELFSACHKLRKRYLQRRRQSDEVPITRISQAALDLADVGPVHPGKIGKPLLRETVDFAPSCSNRIAKVL
jgi:hypothetical protein